MSRGAWFYNYLWKFCMIRQFSLECPPQISTYTCMIPVPPSIFGMPPRNHRPLPIKNERSLSSCAINITIQGILCLTSKICSWTIPLQFFWTVWDAWTDFKLKRLQMFNLYHVISSQTKMSTHPISTRLNLSDPILPKITFIHLISPHFTSFTLLYLTLFYFTIQKAKHSQTTNILHCIFEYKIWKTAVVPPTTRK